MEGLPLFLKNNRRSGRDRADCGGAWRHDGAVGVRSEDTNDSWLVAAEYAFGLSRFMRSKKWKRPIRDWKAALNQFVILYGDRVPIEQ